MHAGLKQMTKTGQYFGGTAQCLLPKCHLDKSHVELLVRQKQICLTVFSAMSHSMPEASDKWHWKGLGPVQNAWNPLGLKTLLGYHTSLCCWKCLTSLQKPVFPLWQQRQNLSVHSWWGEGCCQMLWTGSIHLLLIHWHLSTQTQFWCTGMCVGMHILLNITRSATLLKTEGGAFVHASKCTPKYDLYLRKLCLLEKVTLAVRFSIITFSYFRNPLGPRLPVTTRSFSLPWNPRPPGSSQLVDAPYKHLGICT